MQRVSPVFGDDNTFLQQCGIWDSLVVCIFWIKCVKKEGAVGRGLCVVDGQGRCCGFHGTLCYSLLRAAWLPPAPLLGTDVPYTQLPNQLSLCVEAFGLLTAWDHAGFQ